MGDEDQEKRHKKRHGILHPWLFEKSRKGLLTVVDSPSCCGHSVLLYVIPGILRDFPKAFPKRPRSRKFGILGAILAVSGNPS